MLPGLKGRLSISMEITENIKPKAKSCVVRQWNPHVQQQKERNLLSNSLPSSCHPMRKKSGCFYTILRAIIVMMTCKQTYIELGPEYFETYNSIQALRLKKYLLTVWNLIWNSMFLQDACEEWELAPFRLHEFFSISFTFALPFLFASSPIFYTLTPKQTGIHT